MVAGEDCSLAIKANGSLWGWGANAKLQLGLATAGNYPLPARAHEGFFGINYEDSVSVAAVFQNLNGETIIPTADMTCTIFLKIENHIVATFVLGDANNWQQTISNIPFGTYDVLWKRQIGCEEITLPYQITLDEGVHLSLMATVKETLNMIDSASEAYVALDAETGEEVEVILWGRGISDLNGRVVTLTYDPAVLTYVEEQLAPLNTQDPDPFYVTATVISNIDGELILRLDRELPKDVTWDQVYVSVIFEVIGDGQTYIIVE